MRVLFYGENKEAIQFLKKNEIKLEIGDGENDFWEGEILISYGKRWKIPEWQLERAKDTLQFQMGPPEYPGVGGLPYALYEQSPTFGVTCHQIGHPARPVQRVLSLRRFPMYDWDNVLSVSQRAEHYLITLFYDVMSSFMGNHPPMPLEMTWGQERTAQDIERLSRIYPDMDAEEIAKRAKAGSVFTEIAGKRFQLGGS